MSCRALRYSLTFLLSAIALLLFHANGFQAFRIKSLTPAARGPPFLRQRDLAHGLDRVVGRLQPLRHLAPVQWHGDGQTGPGSDTVGADRCRAAIVPQIVDIDSPLARGLAGLGEKDLR